jgi:hypothetical protein
MASRTITPIRMRMLSRRDLEALAFVGRGYEVMQYQLHEAVFPRRAPNVISRFVSRAVRRGYLLAERLQGVGMNRLRLTGDGVQLLVERGIAKADALFAPRRSVALKDLAHTVWINDVRCALVRSSESPQVISPAWLLQRRLHPAPPAVPDVLAIWKPSDDAAGFLLACEVDLGGESVRGTFAPKLRELANEVDLWAEESPAALLIFTSSVRRAELIRHQMPVFGYSHHVGMVNLLPSQSGVQAITALQTIIYDVFRIKETIESSTTSEATARRER